MFNQGTSGKNFQGKKGKSFRVERQEELGLNLDMTKFRMYDYALGRFTSIDPLADANPQESWTPYQYAYNSPIQYNDPYGDCPWCIGALIGAAADYGLQVAGNLAEGKGLGDSLTDVDGKSIALSAAAGATGAGLLSKIGKVVKTGKTIKNAVKTKKITKVFQKSKKLTSSQKKAVKGLKKQVKEHKKKLSDFKKNPDGFDNKGFLKKASKDVREKIIKSRVKGLKNQINTFKKDIKAIKNGTKEVLEKK